MDYLFERIDVFDEAYASSKAALEAYVSARRDT